MRNKKFIYILILLFGCAQHFDEKEVCGLYVPINYKNNFDTIELKEKGVYSRKVYDKNKKLLLAMEGKWRMVSHKSNIEIDGFYLNIDDDLEQFPSLVLDTSMLINCVLKKQNQSIEFCVGPYLDSNCYLKIK